MVHAVVIAASRDDAVGFVARQPWLEWPGDVVWISPRSRDRCRGVVADVVLMTDAAQRLPSRVIRELREVALPCMLHGDGVAAS